MTDLKADGGSLRSPGIVSLDGRPIGMRAAWAVALMLAMLSAISFIDRQVLALLLPDLERDLGITDKQFGLLLGPVFIIVYNAVLLPAAFFVDRWNRKRMIVTGAVIWTLMTIASGFATSFTQLALLRGGVALGEALLGPAAISMLGDLFSRENRPLPTATYVMGSMLGNTGAAMVGALVLQLSEAAPALTIFPGSDPAWRLTLVAVGVPGLILAIVLGLIGREPARQGYGALGGDEGLLAHLKHSGLIYIGSFVGMGLMNMLVSALALWGPTYLIRSFGLSQVEAGYLLGAVFMGSGIAGTILFPIVYRNRLRMRRMDHAIPFTVLAMLFLIGGGIAGALAQSLPAALAFFALAVFINMGIGTLPTLLIQLYAPSHLRGRISAMLFFIVYLIGAGIAPAVIPWIAEDVLKSSQTLGPAIAIVALIAGIGGSAAFAFVHRSLVRAEDVIRKSE